MLWAYIAYCILLWAYTAYCCGPILHAAVGPYCILL